VITHAHPDHIGGAGQWEKVYLHKADIAPVYRLLNTVYMRKALVKAGRRVNPKTLEKDVTVKDIMKYKSKSEFIPIEEGHVFDLGGKTVRVINTPGHSRGSIVLLLEEQKLMFTGDNVNPLTWLHVPGAVTMEEWLIGAERILELSKTYKSYYFHDLGVQPTEQIAQTIDWVKEIMASQKKNAALPKIRKYPEGKGLTHQVVYRTDRVYGKK
jgi:glyoxylase-like metal-dependent hydrolase (beta-lactamase superfamily II)